MRIPFPKISVILPVFNSEKYLRDSIESILNQSFDNYELIIVNDGSTDKSEAIITSYQDSRIISLKNKENIGLVKSLNIGLQAASGTYIARMDADDISHVDRLKQQFEFVEGHPEIGVLGTSMYQVDESGDRLELLVPPTEHSFIAWKMLFEYPIFHATVLMRQSILEEYGGYDPAYRHVEDIELWTRMLGKTRFANLPDPLYSRRWHKDSICNVNREYQREKTVEIKTRYAYKLLQVPIGKNEYEMMAVGLKESPSTYSQESVKNAIIKLLTLYAAYVERCSPDQLIREKVEEDIYLRISFLKSRDILNNILYMKDKLFPITKDILKLILRKSFGLNKVYNNSRKRFIFK